MVTVGGKTKTRLSAAVLFGASLFASGTSAFAADLSMKDTPLEGSKFEWSAYAQGVSDYIFRGLSQNRRQPTAQGGVDLSYGILYAGTFVSGVNFTDPFGAPSTKVHVETDFYAGIKPKWRDLTFDFGVITYNYPNNTFSHAAGSFDPFYYEVKAGVSTTILKDVAVGATVYYSPDSQFEVGPATTVEGTVSKPIYKYAGVDFAASGTVGGVFYDKSTIYANTKFSTPQDDYVYFNAGITATYNAFSVDLRYWDSNADAGVSPCTTGVSVFQCGGAFAVTGKVAF